ncbi:MULTISPECIES: hypothetical protein [Aeromonas]|uniref:hypothetical protein n=1 Tax=Aeromonas TaxID=642 RepID=UPI001117D9DE|nr:MULTISPECIES: hypothetical protein [Aeromonas]MCF5889753.1 hypothetical protein [Aeromonas veronii]MCX9112558.1 hypothetical protein [Aeromonas veronii]
MVDKIEFILNLLEESSFSVESKAPFLRAFIGALDASNTSRLLIHSISHNLYLRDLINRKIEFDIKDGKGLLYEDLASKLLHIAKTSKYSVALSALISLSFLFSSLKTNTQLSILYFLTNSDRVVFRRKAYKLMLEHYHDDYKNILMQSWQSYQEIECCRLMIEQLDAISLLQFRHDLCNKCNAGWLISKLYIKLGKAHPELLSELRHINSDAYCYCLWILNLKLPSVSAGELIDKSHEQSFLIWCLGRLAEWDLIMDVFNLSNLAPQDISSPT